MILEKRDISQNLIFMNLEKMSNISFVYYISHFFASDMWKFDVVKMFHNEV